MHIAANLAFKMSSNHFIVIAILSSSMSARPAMAAGFVFLIGEDDVKDKRVSDCVTSLDQRQMKKTTPNVRKEDEQQ